MELEMTNNSTSKKDPEQTSGAKATGAKSVSGADNGLTPKLAKALVAAQSDFKNATLNAVNPHFKSKYATLSEVRDTVVPVLAKHDLAITQFTDMIGERIFLISRLIHSSGEFMEAKFPIVYDKPQAMGSAITYARRYALSSMCNISADEDDDANTAQGKKPDGGLVL